MALATPLAAQRAPAAADPTWLKGDPAARRVTLDLIAGETPANGGLNFNGAASGKVTVLVPEGWEVVVRVTNQDGNLPHSAELISGDGALPVQAVPPAVAGAETTRLMDGFARGDSSTFRFTAPAGSYRLFCAVPGHGLAGMWIGLTVTAKVTSPALRTD